MEHIYGIPFNCMVNLTTAPGLCTCPKMMWENAHKFLCKVTKKDPNDHSSTTLRLKSWYPNKGEVSLSTRNNKPTQSRFAKSDRWHMFKQNNCSKHKFLNWDDPLPPSMQWLSRLFVGNIPKARALSSWWNPCMHLEGMGITIKKH